tara:strand:+ start:15719 stop:15886 length:168 start_codon:yes stop_codon:yes gene_type:complete
MNDDKISKQRQQQLMEMMEVMEDTVEYFCDQHMVSGEVAWAMVASLADAKLGQFK